MNPSQSPVEQYGNNQVSGSGYGSGQSDSGKSPLSLSLGFLKSLTDKKSTRVDGQPLKRRGPKPDSKPALTRRQELNRQAQRTHRERKELYIKALEEEIIRIKQNFSTVSRDKANLAEENRQLKALLAQHGIVWSGTKGVSELARHPSAGYTSSASNSGSYGPASSGFSPPLNAQRNPSSTNTSPSPINIHGSNFTPQAVQPKMDYDQAGIDFVLTLERPCMAHIPYLMERASEPDGLPCGHALMASYPPDPADDCNSEMPPGHGIQNAEPGQNTYALDATSLANLLDLSKRLNLEGEITPVMAWGMVLEHPRFLELGEEDFANILTDIKDKVRCYGFGAVLEEFEFQDALENIFSTPPDPMIYF